MITYHLAKLPLVIDRVRMVPIAFPYGSSQMVGRSCWQAVGRLKRLAAGLVRASGLGEQRAQGIERCEDLCKRNETREFGLTPLPGMYRKQEV